MRDRTLVPKLSGLAADSFHALEDFFDRGEMLLLILLGNERGTRHPPSVAGIGERKADGGRAPLLAGTAPGDALPSEVTSLEFLFLLGGFVELDPLVFGEPVDVLVDKRLQPTARGHLKEDGGHFVGRLAGDALVGFLRLPRVGAAYPNRSFVLGA